MNNYEAARQIWNTFKEKEGSRHIASPVAIAALTSWLRYEKPNRILEIGAGIGTLTYSAVKTLNRIFPTRNYSLISLESNSFCCHELAKNLAAFKDDFTTFSDVSDIPKDSKDFDFVITDGGNEAQTELFSSLSQRAFIFIEGNRREQSQTLETVLQGRRFIKADVRNLRRGILNDGANGIKGYRIYKINPTFKHRIIFRWLNLKTSFVYRWRALMNKSDVHKNFQNGDIK